MKDKIKSLYELGDPRTIDNNGKWPDYLHYGFTDEDIPALIELVTDPTFNAKSSDDNQIWLPLHVWRILGQLKSKDAIQPLIDMLDSWQDDDWATEEIPQVMAMIGASAIEPLKAYSKEKNHAEFALVIALESLKEIVIIQPDLRNGVLEIYRQYMLEPNLSMYSLNGLLMVFLIDLQAHELIDEIRILYNQDCVDSSVAGDLGDIEIELGLRKRTIPRPHYGELSGFYDDIENSAEPFIREVTKVGRNNPCPCGSGKKFKKCCLN